MRCESASGSTADNLETAPQAAAFFDMGGSLLRGSATMSLAAAAVKEGFVSKRELALGLASGLSFLRKGASTDRTAQIRDRVLRMVKGRRRADLLSICEGSMSKIVNDVRPAAKELLRAHEDLGNARVAVSAVPTEVVSQVAMELQLDYGIGTTASVDENGRYTGELDGPFCVHDGKAQVVETMAREHGWELADCYAYAGSIANLPMLEAVGNPRVIEPDRKLKSLAEKRGWPIVNVDRRRHGRLESRPAGIAFGVG
jgi:HAD superfamily hydrolase (TIGR01490 family)